MILGARALHLAYGSTPALAGVDLSVDEGELVALVGPSGSGKTSLLYCLAGLVRPTSGSVRVADTELTELDEDAAAAVRRRFMGFVFQFAELIPELTIGENIELPLSLLGKKRSVVRDRVGQLVERLGILDIVDRRPDQVSGGQAQRAAVARAVIHDPPIVFADEPTGALDSANGQTVLTHLVDLTREKHTAVVIVTHDESVAAVADRRIRMSDGLGIEVS